MINYGAFIGFLFGAMALGFVGLLISIVSLFYEDLASGAAIVAMFVFFALCAWAGHKMMPPDLGADTGRTRITNHTKITIHPTVRTKDND